MSAPWEKEFEIDSIGLIFFSGRSSLPISCRQIDGINSLYFFLGQMLAHLHSDGIRYTDLHSGNFGLLPLGGLTIIDPGGIIRCEISPEIMIDDFIVPFGDMNEKEFLLFVSGYLEIAFTEIDSTHEGFSNAIMGKLGLSRPEYDPREFKNINLSIPDIISSSPENECHRYKLPTLLLILCSKINTSDKYSIVINSLFNCKPKGNETIIEYIARHTGNQDINHLTSLSILDQKFYDPGVMSYKENSINNIVFNQDDIEKLLSFINYDQKNSVEIRNALIDVLCILAKTECDAGSEKGIRSLITISSLLFSIVTTGSVDTESYERFHYKLWNIHNSLMTAKYVSLKKCIIISSEVTINQILFFIHSGRFELEFFGASISEVVNHDNASLATHSAIRSLDCFKRALTILYYISEKEYASTMLSEILYWAVSLYAHLLRTISFSIHNLNQGVDILSYWGGSAERLNDNFDWISKFEKYLKGDLKDIDEIQNLFQEGISYFIHIDFKIQNDEQYIQLSRQDIFNGIGKTFSKE